MNISSIYGSSASPLIDSIYGENSKNNSAQETKNNISYFGADSVTISPEAKEKLAAMMEAKEQGEKPQSEEQAESGAASGGGKSASATDDDAKLQSLKAKLASLQASLGQAGVTEIANISAQIAEVMGEITALEAQGA